MNAGIRLGLLLVDSRNVRRVSRSHIPIIRGFLLWTHSHISRCIIQGTRKALHDLAIMTLVTNSSCAHHWPP
jgi:hypothetical protein